MNVEWAKIYSILHFFFLFTFLAHIIRTKKSPSSTLAWFFIVAIQPLVGLPIYFIFGSRKMKPRWFNPRTQKKLTEVDDSLQSILMLSGSSSAHYNHDIKLITTGEIAYQELMVMIDQAQKSILIETFIFADDEVGQALLKKLVIKAREGLEVRVLLDSMGALMSSHPNFSQLILAGGHFQKSMPFKLLQGNVNLRNHRKIVVIDNHLAMAGGMNIALEYMGPTPYEKRWTDLAIRIEGQLVNDLSMMFQEDWFNATKVKIFSAKEFKFPQANEHLAQLVKSGPHELADTIYDWLLSSIYSAEKRIILSTPYFIPDEALAKALELAVKRGVKVQIIIPQKSNHAVADLCRSTYLEQVYNFGVEIYLYPQMIHAKVFLFDHQRGMVSSANLDNRSMLINDECGIILYSGKDIHQLDQWFLEITQKCSKGLPAKTKLDHWLGGAARLLSPII
ncbi:MAG: phospholipase D-like domain-containing protein [Bacteriovoracaceae bacterium]